MIEIITENVEMPELDERRFLKDVNNAGRWVVIDTIQDKTIYKGSYENVSLITHNLNKKYYRTLKATP